MKASGRLRRGPRSDAGGRDPEEPEDSGFERATPGVAELFSPLREDGSHVILDLGPAVGAHFRLYSRYARQIRFADLLPRPPHGQELRATLGELPPGPRAPYDVILIWNLMDLLGPREREPLIRRLEEITAPGARLYAVADASERPTTQPLRYTLLDVDRVRQEAEGPAEPAEHPLLPAEMERLLGPFQVARAFTLRTGWREYVAVKGVEEG